MKTSDCQVKLDLQITVKASSFVGLRRERETNSLTGKKISKHRFVCYSDGVLAAFQPWNSSSLSG